MQKEKKNMKKYSRLHNLIATLEKNNATVFGFTSSYLATLTHVCMVAHKTIYQSN